MKLLHTTTGFGLELEVWEGEPRQSVDLIVSGGFLHAPSWEEYLEIFSEENHPHLQLIRQAIEELGWVGETVDVISNSTTFRFDDYRLAFTWRAWCELMSAIVGKGEGYMAYYC